MASSRQSCYMYRGLSLEEDTDLQVRAENELAPPSAALLSLGRAVARQSHLQASLAGRELLGPFHYTQQREERISLPNAQQQSHTGLDESLQQVVGGVAFPPFQSSRVGNFSTNTFPPDPVTVASLNVPTEAIVHSALPSVTIIPNQSTCPTSSSRAIQRQHGESNVPVGGGYASGRHPHSMDPRSSHIVVTDQGQMPPPPPATMIDGTMGIRATRSRTELLLSEQVALHRQNHMRSERERRQHMNAQYDTLRRLVPQDATQSGRDTASLLTNTTRFIQRCQRQRALLEQQIGQLRQWQAGRLNMQPPNPDVSIARPEGSVATHGSSVSIIVCGSRKFSVTITYPRHRRSTTVLGRIICACAEQHLECVGMIVNSCDGVILYTMQLEAEHDEFVWNTMQADLQGIVSRSFNPVSASGQVNN